MPVCLLTKDQSSLETMSEVNCFLWPLCDARRCAKSWSKPSMRVMRWKMRNIYIGLQSNPHAQGSFGNVWSREHPRIYEQNLKVKETLSFNVIQLPSNLWKIALLLLLLLLLLLIITIILSLLINFLTNRSHSVNGQTLFVKITTKPLNEVGQNVTGCWLVRLNDASHTWDCRFGPQCTIRDSLRSLGSNS